MPLSSDLIQAKRVQRKLAEVAVDSIQEEISLRGQLSASMEFCLAVHDLWHWTAMLHRTPDKRKAEIDREVKRAMVRVQEADRAAHRVMELPEH